jgi:hypothetical protein
VTRLIQIKKGNVRRVALVDEPNVRLLDTCFSIHKLAHIAIDEGKKLGDVAGQLALRDAIDYNLIYSGRSEWRLLPPIDHPEESARCLLSGTGLTHVGSARDRQSMHATTSEDLTDSMKMFRWGVEGGRPGAGRLESLRNGFTRARATPCARMESHSIFRPMPKMEVKKRRSPACT